MKVKKGWVAVRVGDQNQRFVIPISYLNNPHFQTLLHQASELYDYRTDGPLMLPCSVQDFLHLQSHIQTLDL